MQSTKTNYSEIREHFRSKSNLISDNGFKNLLRASHKSDLRIVEPLYITEHKPELNSNDSYQDAF